METAAACFACSAPVEDRDPDCGACGAARPPNGWPADPRVGQSFLGSLAIVRRLGYGGTGSVYLAEEPGTGSRIAVKFLRRELDLPEILHRFRLEAVLTKSLGIPQVVQTYDFGELDDGTHYLTMEYVDGEGLDTLLADGKPLPIETTIEVARQVLAALAVAHDRGVIHRDVKPGNLFLARGSDGLPLVKILDFGFARIAADGAAGVPRVTQGFRILGTPAYMSPEQARGSRQVDHRSDLYSLACVLYRCLTGFPPFQAKSPAEVLRMHLEEPPQPPSEIWPGVPPALDRLLVDLLRKDPGQRPPDARSVLARLDEAFPATAGRWDPDTLGEAAMPRAELLRQVGRYVMGTKSLPGLPGQVSGAIARPSRWPWIAAGVGIAVVVIAVAAWLVS